MHITEIPLDGSLGLLAYGDIAFKAWRKLKQEKHAQENKGDDEEK